MFIRVYEKFTMLHSGASLNYLHDVKINKINQKIISYRDVCRGKVHKFKWMGLGGDERTISCTCMVNNEYGEGMLDRFILQVLSLRRMNQNY